MATPPTSGASVHENCSKFHLPKYEYLALTSMVRLLAKNAEHMAPNRISNPNYHTVWTQNMSEHAKHNTLQYAYMVMSSFSHPPNAHSPNDRVAPNRTDGLRYMKYMQRPPLLLQASSTTSSPPTLFARLRHVRREVDVAIAACVCRCSYITRHDAHTYVLTTTPPDAKALSLPPFNPDSKARAINASNAKKALDTVRTCVIRTTPEAVELYVNGLCHRVTGERMDTTGDVHAQTNGGAHTNPYSQWEYTVDGHRGDSVARERQDAVPLVGSFTMDASVLRRLNRCMDMDPATAGVDAYTDPVSWKQFAQRQKAQADATRHRQSQNRSVTWFCHPLRHGEILIHRTPSGDLRKCVVVYQVGAASPFMMADRPDESACVVRCIGTKGALEPAACVPMRALFWPKYRYDYQRDVDRDVRDLLVPVHHELRAGDQVRLLGDAGDQPRRGAVTRVDPDHGVAIEGGSGAAYPGDAVTKHYDGGVFRNMSAWCTSKRNGTVVSCSTSAVTGVFGTDDVFRMDVDRTGDGDTVRAPVEVWRMPLWEMFVNPAVYFIDAMDVYQLTFFDKGGKKGCDYLNEKFWQVVRAKFSYAHNPNENLAQDEYITERNGRLLFHRVNEQGVKHTREMIGNYKQFNQHDKTASKLRSKPSSKKLSPPSTELRDGRMRVTYHTPSVFDYEVQMQLKGNGTSTSLPPITMYGDVADRKWVMHEEEDGHLRWTWEGAHVPGTTIHYQEVCSKQAKQAYQTRMQRQPGVTWKEEYLYTTGIFDSLYMVCNNYGSRPTDDPHKRKTLQQYNLNACPRSAKALYKAICTKYYGLPLSACSEYTSNQSRPIASKAHRRTVTRPVRADGVGHHQVDTLFINLDTIQQKGLSRREDLGDSRQQYAALMVCIDVFSKYVWIRYLGRKGHVMENIVKELATIWAQEGPPKYMQTDNGKEYVNRGVTELAAMHNVERRRCRAYYSQCDGCVERMNRTIRKIIADYYSSDDASNARLSKALQTQAFYDKIAYQYNVTDHSTTKWSPFQIQRGRPPPLAQVIVGAPRVVQWDLDDRLMLHTHPGFVETIERRIGKRVSDDKEIRRAIREAIEHHSYYIHSDQEDRVHEYREDADHPLRLVVFSQREVGRSRSVSTYNTLRLHAHTIEPVSGETDRYKWMLGVAPTKRPVWISKISEDEYMFDDQLFRFGNLTMRIPLDEEITRESYYATWVWKEDIDPTRYPASSSLRYAIHDTIDIQSELRDAETVSDARRAMVQRYYDTDTNETKYQQHTETLDARNTPARPQGGESPPTPSTTSMITRSTPTLVQDPPSPTRPRSNQSPPMSPNPSRVSRVSRSSPATTRTSRPSSLRSWSLQNRDSNVGGSPTDDFSYMDTATKDARATLGAGGGAGNVISGHGWDDYVRTQTERQREVTQSAKKNIYNFGEQMIQRSASKLMPVYENDIVRLAMSAVRDRRSSSVGEQIRAEGKSMRQHRDRSNWTLSLFRVIHVRASKGIKRYMVEPWTGDVLYSQYASEQSRLMVRKMDRGIHRESMFMGGRRASGVQHFTDGASHARFDACPLCTSEGGKWVGNPEISSRPIWYGAQDLVKVNLDREPVAAHACTAGKPCVHTMPRVLTYLGSRPVKCGRAQGSRGTARALVGGGGDTRPQIAARRDDQSTIVPFVPSGAECASISTSASARTWMSQIDYRSLN